MQCCCHQSNKSQYAINGHSRSSEYTAPISYIAHYTSLAYVTAAAPPSHCPPGHLPPSTNWRYERSKADWLDTCRHTHS